MPKIYGNLQKPRRSYAGLARFVSSLFWVAVAGCLLYVVFFSGWFSVRKVDVQGTSLVSADQIKGLVPTGDPIWFFPKERVSSQIMVDPRIQSVDILKGLPDSIRVVVHERQPALAWTSGSNLTLLDVTGLAFAQYPLVSAPSPSTPAGTLISTLPKVQDTKSLPVSLGQSVVAGGFTAFVAEVSKQMGILLPTVPVDHFEVADTTYDVTIVTKPGMQVRLSSLADPGVQIRNLSRLVQQKKVTTTSKVDLRIDRWAYVQ